MGATGATERVVNLLQLATSFNRRRRLRHIREWERELGRLTDAEIRERCLELTSSPKLGHDSSTDEHGLRALIGKPLTDRDFEALAFAAEAFGRFPPGGFDPGTRLYDEQLLTAASLMRGAIVQMDTGEGKTFAIAAAGLALLRTHPKVYVLTANPYLAARDAAQTAPFWHGVGVSVGRALPEEFEPDSEAGWEAQVVYTTLSAFAFRSLAEDHGVIPRTIRWSAVILDEADAILLEQCTGGPYQTVLFTDPSTKDWSLPLSIARTLDRGDFDVSPGIEPSARLTPAGERKVSALPEVERLGAGRRLLLLHDLELAFIAITLAEEGHDYEIDGGRVVTIDPASGWRTRDIRHPWVAPLEQARGLRAEPRRVPREAVDGLTLLRRFDHICGASGTVIHEALDYALLLGIPPAVVAPRVPRAKGRLPDLVGSSREKVYDWIVKQVAEHGEKRPVLIATGATHQAHELAALLRRELPSTITVRAVDGETIARERLFEDAGRPGMTIVSTRVAGRGVDIVLTAEARANGGTMLIAVGHDAEARLDRQLLGRVGRRGDPYSAQFVSYPEDRFIRTIMNPKLLAASAGLVDEPIQHRMFNRRMAKAQFQIRVGRLSAFASATARGQAEGEIYDMLHEWRHALGEVSENELPPAFMTLLVDRLMTTNFSGLSADGDRVLREPETIVDTITGMLECPDEKVGLLVRTTGQPAASARATLRTFVAARLNESIAENAKARSIISEHGAAQEEALLDLRMLRVIRGLQNRDRSQTEHTHLLEQVLAGDGRIDEVQVSTEAIAARRSRIEALLRRPFAELRLEGEQLLHSVPEDQKSVDELAGLILSLDADDGGAEWSDATDLLEYVRRAEEVRLASVEEYDERWQDFAERSAWRVASETISDVTERLMTGLSQIRFQLSNIENPARYSVAYTAAVEDLRRELEAEMTVELCANLTAARDPNRLDDLFAELEHAIAGTAAPLSRLSLPALPPPQPVTRLAAPHSLDDKDGLVYEYVQALQERLGERAPPRERLFPALIAFQELSPPATLTDPDRVAIAYATWKNSKIRDEVAPWHRHALDSAVKGYLEFLFDRGVAAPMPTGLVESSRSLMRRTRDAFVSGSVVIGTVALAPAAIVAVLLWLSPQRARVDLPASLDLIERMLSGGSFVTGSALGVAVAAVIGGFYLRLTLGLPPATGAGAVPIENAGTLVLLAAASLVFLRPTGGGIGHLVGSLAALVLLMVAGLIFRNSVWQFERLTRFAISAGVAAVFAAAAALPFLVDLAGSERPLVIAGVSAGVLVATLPLRRARIPAVALRLDANAPDEVEARPIRRPIRARLSVVPYLFALAVAWGTSCAALDAGRTTTLLVAAVSYAAVLGVWAEALARSATNPDRWRKRMRQLEQAYAPSDSHPTLDDALASARRRLMLTEMTCTLPLIALATVLAETFPDQILQRLPVGLAALTASAITIELARMFARSLADPFTGVTESPRLERARDDSQALGDYLGDAMRHVTRKLGVVVVIFVALEGLANVLGVWDLLVDAVHWVRGLVT